MLRIKGYPFMTKKGVAMNLSFFKKSKPQKAIDITLARGPYIRKRKEAPASPKALKIARLLTKANKEHPFRIFVAGGSRGGNDPVYGEEAFRLGEKIAEMNFRLDFGLSGQGIMGAVARGVIRGWTRKAEKGELPISGITTKEYLAAVQGDALVDQVKEIIVAHTLEERKKQLLNADFVVFAPGGVGTLDELVYDCVAMQDGFLPLKPFIIYNVNGYFHHILEYLKEMQLKGFADPIPFIVVDDSFEAGVAFEVLKERYQSLKERYQTPPKKEEVFDFVQKIIYQLPYILQVKQESPNKHVKSILNDIDKNDLLAPELEKAYLRKEIERMYGRLARAGQDTAHASEKLDGLKEKRKKALL